MIGVNVREQNRGGAGARPEQRRACGLIATQNVERANLHRMHIQRMAPDLPARCRCGWAATRTTRCAWPTPRSQRSWPARWRYPARSAVYVEAESVPQITNERAIALGLNRHKLWLLMPENGHILDLTQVAWQEHLLNMATTIKPELIIIDSLTSISSAGQNSVEDTNRLLMFLVGIARELDCGLLVLHHLRKPGSSQLSLPGMSLHDFRGSSHITAMARTVLGLNVIQNGRQFSLNGPRRLDLVKTNLGNYPEGIGIELQREGEKVRFVYGAAPGFDQDSPGENCEQWIVKYLEENGPTRPAELIAAGEKAGFSRPTIYRVRKQLQGVIRNTNRNYKAPDNAWYLAADEEEEEEDTDDAADADDDKVEEL